MEKNNWIDFKNKLKIKIQDVWSNKKKRNIILAVIFFFFVGMGMGIYATKTRKSKNTNLSSTILEKSPIQNLEIYAILHCLEKTDSVKQLPITTLAENLMLKQENLTEDSTLLLHIAHEIDSLSEGQFCLNQADFEFLKKQYELKNAYTINPDSLKNMRFVPQNEVDILENQGNLKEEEVHEAWANFFEKYGKNGFVYHISTPYFSVNQDIAIITVRMKCGAFCGGGHKAILIKEEGKWKLLTKMYKWNS